MAAAAINAIAIMKTPHNVFQEILNADIGNGFVVLIVALARHLKNVAVKLRARFLALGFSIESVPFKGAILGTGEKEKPARENDRYQLFHNIPSTARGCMPIVGVCQ